MIVIKLGQLESGTNYSTILMNLAIRKKIPNTHILSTSFIDSIEKINAIEILIFSLLLE